MTHFRGPNTAFEHLVLYTECSLLVPLSYLGVIAAWRYRVQNCLGFLAGLVHCRCTEAHYASS
jgi:hypothetical protein